MSNVMLNEHVVYGKFLQKEALSHLEGKILTQIDAVISNENQNKAFKDIVKNLLWDFYYSCRDQEIQYGSGSLEGK